MSSTVRVSWKKAALYLDIEPRYTSCQEGCYALDTREAASLVDRNTILVCAILGSLDSGEFEGVAGLNQLLQETK